MHGAAHPSMVELSLSTIRVVPGAVGASLTVLAPSRPPVIVSTARFVTEACALEHGLGEGPSLEAATSTTTVLVEALDQDERWPRLRLRVEPLKVSSALSTPLTAAAGMVGVLTVYAYDRHAFHREDAQLLEAIAQPTAVAVHNAQLLTQTEQEAAALHRAEEGRSTIERAIGIMMSRNGGSEERANALLQQMCDKEHQELSVMAQEIVDEALGGAMTRYTQKRFRPGTPTPST